MANKGISNVSDQLHVLRPQGRLDNANSQAFEKEALGVIDGGGRWLVVDMGSLDYISSAGLRVVITLAKRMRAAGGRLGFCSLKAEVADVFEISGVDTLVEILPDMEQATSGAEKG